MSTTEQAKYEVLESYGGIEIRDYTPMIVAETEVSGEREAAIREGFGIIADYIFGNNESTSTVAMTAPVLQLPAERIAVTRPVTQQGTSTGWKVRFVMPSAYSISTLPKPNNNAVIIDQVPGQRFVAIRFSGTAGAVNLKEKTAEVEAFIKERKLTTLSQPTYAFFDPPWTLPFLRRNEVMIEIDKTSSRTDS